MNKQPLLHKSFTSVDDHPKFTKYSLQKQIKMYQLKNINQLNQNQENMNLYDPFQSPPNIQKAQRHYLATLIGHQIRQNADKQFQICPCCENIINKIPFSICCDQNQLLFLGLGYPLYYKMTKYFAWIILLVFVLSGSAFYFLITMNCRQNCLDFMGFRIINFEKQEEQSVKSVQTFTTITSIAIFGFVIYIKSLINSDITKLQSKVTCPSKYTIMIQHLSSNFTELQLTQWIEKTFEHTPVTVNLAYDVAQLQQTYQRRNKLTIKRNKLLIQMRAFQETANDDNIATPDIRKQDIIIEIQQFQAQIQKLDVILTNYKSDIIECKKIGTAFVTFQKAQIAQKLIEQYDRPVLQILFQNALSDLLRRQKLTFKGRTVFISKAPAPRQIIWQNLSYSYFRSFGFQVLFIFAMTLLIWIAFDYQFRFANYAYELRMQGKQSGKALIIVEALVMSVIVVIVNSLLRVIIQIFSKLKRYHSYTAYQASFCFYYSLMYIFNSCFMIYIVHGRLPQTTNQLLLYDIHLIMLANAFSEPLFKIFDPIMWYRIIWKRYVMSLKISNNPYTQVYVHKLWQGHQVSNADNYQYAARILFVTVWFSHAAPLGVIFSFIGLLCDYWIGKALLLRVYKKPENISKDIAKPILMSLQLLPLVYICGVLQFTYKVSSQENVVQFLLNFMQYSVTTTVMIFCIVGYFVIAKPQEKKVTQVPYSRISMGFGFNYDTQNPITKLKGQIDYLYGVLKTKNKTQHQQQLISELISIGRNSLKDMQTKRSQIGRLKYKMLKRMSLIKSQDLNQSGQMNQIIGINKRGKKNNLAKLKTQEQQESGDQSSSQQDQNAPHDKKKFKLKKIGSIFVQ